MLVRVNPRLGFQWVTSAKLQIELLRAYKPDTFKTPGTQVNVGVKSDVFVLTEEQRHILMDYNRQWLLDHLPPPAEEPPAAPQLGDATEPPGSKTSLRTPTTYDENNASDTPAS